MSRWLKQPCTSSGLIGLRYVIDECRFTSPELGQNLKLALESRGNTRLRREQRFSPKALMPPGPRGGLLEREPPVVEDRSALLRPSCCLPGSSLRGVPASTFCTCDLMAFDTDSFFSLFSSVRPAAESAKW